MKYFYARVSTKEQNLDRQLEVVKQYPIDRVFADKQSGKNFDREEYQELKRVVKKGDEVFVKELDRLGRNKDGVKDEIKWFHERGVILRILDIPTTLLDFGDQTWVSDMVTNILIEVMGAVAEQERKKIRQRQKEGFAAMKVVNGKKVSAKTGRACGRPEIENPDFEKFFEAKKRGEMSVEECCAALGISRATWYNKVKTA